LQILMNKHGILQTYFPIQNIPTVIQSISCGLLATNRQQNWLK